jgi:hypothetical protein
VCDANFFISCVALPTLFIVWYKQLVFMSDLHLRFVSSVIVSVVSRLLLIT